MDTSLRKIATTTRAGGLLLVLLLTVAAAVVPALPVLGREPAVRYVSTSGSDAASGTSQAPWRTLGYALQQLEAGDQLLVAGGTYLERIRSPQLAPGRPDAPIVVRAVAGQRPVVQGLLWIKNADYWVFDGINVTWDPATGQSNEHMVKLTNGVGWVFQNAQVWGARSFAGVLVTQYGGAPDEPRDWSIRGSCINRTASTNDTNQDHLIYVNTGTSPGPGVIEGNLMFEAPNGEGVKFGGPSSSSGGAANIVLRQNTIVGAAQGVLLAWGAHDIRLERNLIGGTSGGYGAMRGYRLTGSGNVASGNVVFDSARIFLNDEGYRGIADGGGNRMIDSPGFDGVGACDRYRPGAAEATGTGHTAWQQGSGGSTVPAPSDPVTTEPSSSSGTEDSPDLDRIAGSERIGTAVEVARAGWDRSAKVVLARADDPADALAGATLAGDLDAPLLITYRQRLDARVAEALRDLGTTQAVLLGGRTALSDDVERSIRSLGIDVERVAGADRASTAARLARRLAPDPGGTALLVRGSHPTAPDRAWADALAVSGMAARRAAAGKPWPVLVAEDTVPEATWAALEELRIRRVFVIGGRVAIPDGVVRALRGRGLEVARLAGATRYETTLAVAARDPSPVGHLVFATGAAFPDGLAAGALAARLDATLVLVPPAASRDQVWRIVDELGRPRQGTLVGGSRAIPEQLAERLRSILD